MTDVMELYREMGIRPSVYRFGEEIEAQLKERFEAIDKMAEYNQLKVIRAMQENRVNAECFNLRNSCACACAGSKSQTGR